MIENNKIKLTNREIIEKGSKVLIKELGYSGFLRYIKCSRGLNVDGYLELEDEIFEAMTIDEIHDNAKEYNENYKAQIQESKVMTILDKRELKGFKKGFKEGREKVRKEIVEELIKMESETDFIFIS